MQVIYFIFESYMKEKTLHTPNFDSIQPQLCINAKLRKLHRLLNTAYQSKINPFGLRGSMLSILFMIGKKKNINQKSIAEALVLDQSTISRDLKRLIQKGWVQVSKGADSRNSELSLTTEGYLLLEEVSPIWAALHQKVEAILGTFNIQQIDQIIGAIQNNLVEIKK